MAQLITCSFFIYEKRVRIPTTPKLKKKIRKRVLLAKITLGTEKIPLIKKKKKITGKATTNMAPI